MTEAANSFAPLGSTGSASGRNFESENVVAETSAVARSAGGLVPDNGIASGESTVTPDRLLIRPTTVGNARGKPIETTIPDICSGY